MAAQLVPIRLSVTNGDLYTLWAPRWRDAGDEWEGFLGKDEDLYAFDSVADLAALLADPPLRQRQGQAARERFLARYQLADSARKYHALYAAVAVSGATANA